MSSAVPVRYRLGLLGAGIAAVVLVLWNAHEQYFIFDDWAYWTDRQDWMDGGGVKGFAQAMLLPHNGQAPTLTFLVWWPLDRITDPHSYLPYLIPALAVHLATGWLMFEVLVRRVRPVVALGAASVFLVLGNAAGAASTGSHLGWTIALPATFAGLLAIERIRDKRKLALVVAGLAILGGSAMGFVVLVVLAGALVLHGRFRPALLAGACFGLVYAAWLLLTGLMSRAGTGIGVGTVDIDLGRVGAYVGFMWRGLTTAVGDVIGWRFAPLAAVLLVAVAGVAVSAWRSRSDPTPLALAGGAVVFFGLAAMRGVQLDLPAYTFDQPRYLLVASAFLLPALALLVDRVIYVDGRLVVPLVLLLGWALLANATQHIDIAEDRVALGVHNRSTIETAASFQDLTPLIDGVLLAGESFRITVRQLDRLENRGALPCVIDLDKATGFAVGRGLPEPGMGDLECRGVQSGR